MIGDLGSGIHVIPLADYVADPAIEPSLSASVAHTLLTVSPLHAWFEHPRLNPDYQSVEARRFDIGTVAHAILLENDRTKIAVVEADDWRTLAARKCETEAREHGLIPVLKHQMVEIEAMVSVAHDAIGCSELASTIGVSGKAEQTLIWQENGIYLRCRPDWRSDDWRLVIDYKTTATKAEPSSWSRGPLLGCGHDLQAAFVRQGVKALTGVRPTVVFLVQEVDAPYAVSLVGLSPDFIEFADSKYLKAVALWKQCRETCNWPGYPTRIAYADLPGWAVTQWTERSYPMLQEAP